jgi:hypothetical protein
VFLNLIRLKDDLIITTLKNEYLDVPQVIWIRVEALAKDLNDNAT